VIAELEAVAKDTKYVIPKIILLLKRSWRSISISRHLPGRQACGKGMNLVGFQDSSLVENYQGWIDWYWQKYNTPDISLACLRVS